SARSQAVLGSSDCSSAFLALSSSACFCCSSVVFWPPHAASAAAEPMTAVPPRKSRRVLVIFMGVPSSSWVPSRAGDGRGGTGIDGVEPGDLIHVVARHAGGTVGARG